MLSSENHRFDHKDLVGKVMSLVLSMFSRFVTSTSASLNTLKPLIVWTTKKLWKILQEMGILNTLPAPREICMQVNKQQLEPDMEQQIGSNLGKEYVKTAYYQPSHLTYM